MLAPAKIPAKLRNSLSQYNQLRFDVVQTVETEFTETREIFREEPTHLSWQPANKGMKWGDSWVTGWFRGVAAVPISAAGKRLFVRFKTDPVGLFSVEGVLRLNDQLIGGLDCNHHCVLVEESATEGRSFKLSVEAYALHSFPSTMPFSEPIVVDENCREFYGLELVTERPEVSAFVFDLQLLLDAYNVLDANSFRRATILNCLVGVFECIHAMPTEHDEATWLPGVLKARAVMAPILETRNSASAPEHSVIAHSHIDTAWLWPIAETRRKFSRTYSTMVNLLQQFPEVTFFQSSPAHAEYLRQDYPELFSQVKQLIVEGRWEPNGAMWVEPDCNIPNGESLVRQCLIGIQWTREHFNYNPDTFWQPDVFGYSASLPQILKQCNVEYFCTTKMAWNDTTRFPFDSFRWVGIDGTSVVSHLASIPQWIDAKEVQKEWNWTQHKDAMNGRLLAYGYGDGGGGPRLEDMEQVRRMRDFDGLPKLKNETVSAFMKNMERGAHQLPEYCGELYLELHRGTLTTNGNIKKQNRATEYDFLRAEMLAVFAQLEGHSYPKAAFTALWKRFLILQFHDILPGTSIQRAHEEALQEFDAIRLELAQIIDQQSAKITEANVQSITLFNPLSWPINEWEIETTDALEIPEATMQQVINLEGNTRLFVADALLPACGMRPIKTLEKPLQQTTVTPFTVNGSSIETPYFLAELTEYGSFTSLIDKEARRELVLEETGLNRFMIGEDIPEFWDNWDIDSDQELKQVFCGKSEGFTVIANGLLVLQIRQTIHLTKNSTLQQDIFFFARNKRIEFRTSVDWQDQHMLLKTAFPLRLNVDRARHEIQFGYVERSTHRNTLHDRARFEVSQQKWTDLSEVRYGVALLNNCKYGLGTYRSTLALTLIKSGTHPDPTADKGQHYFTYALLPHNGSFNAESVIRPAYELNVKPLVLYSKTQAKETALLSINQPNIIVESIKWAEEENAFVIRLYEAEKSFTHVRVQLSVPAKKAALTNLLEENATSVPLRDGAVELQFNPFEVLTLLVYC